MATTKDVPATEDLVQIKGLGPSKAKLLQEALEAYDDPTQATATELAEIDGVSEQLAKQVIKVVKGGTPTAPPKKATRKKAARKKAARKPAARASATTSNGHSTLTLTAGQVRRLARALDEAGEKTEAKRLRSGVADLLDEEPIPSSRIS